MGALTLVTGCADRIDLPNGMTQVDAERGKTFILDRNGTPIASYVSALYVGKQRLVGETQDPEIAGSAGKCRYFVIDTQDQRLRLIKDDPTARSFLHDYARWQNASSCAALQPSS